jgi:hypothetical protein
VVPKGLVCLYYIQRGSEAQSSAGQTVFSKVLVIDTSDLRIRSDVRLYIYKVLVSVSFTYFLRTTFNNW